MHEQDRGNKVITYVTFVIMTFDKTILEHSGLKNKFELGSRYIFKPGLRCKIEPGLKYTLKPGL